ncbi:MAG: hypothetical protein FWH41_03200, partial [Treponema sp.]|nr:hypothetical protein [Treponema sp.]
MGCQGWGTREGKVPNLFAYQIGDVGNSTSKFNNNYAFDTIQVGRSSLGYDGEIDWRTPGSNAAGQDGAAVDDATRRMDVFWTGTMGFNPAVWDTADTAGISSRGYPLLMG